MSWNSRGRHGAEGWLHLGCDRRLLRTHQTGRPATLSSKSERGEGHQQRAQAEKTGFVVLAAERTTNSVDARI